MRLTILSQAIYHALDLPPSLYARACALAAFERYMGRA